MAKPMGSEFLLAACATLGALALSAPSGAAQHPPTAPGRALDPGRNVQVPDVVVPLDPIFVEVLRPVERERRASGSPLYHLSRSEIEEDLGQGLSLGEVLQRRIPGMTSAGKGGLTGARPCVEYRRPQSFVSRCQPPIVVVDGIRIAEPNHFFDTIPLEHVESLTVLSAAAASIRYGTGALNGAIRVETRRPGTGAARARTAGADELASGSPNWGSAYDWNLEASGHPWVRAFGGATVGSLGGLAVALGVAGPCSPLHRGRSAQCSRAESALASLATFTLPAVGGALGANLLGRTDGSRGRLLMTTLAALTPMFMGYFFATPRSDRVEFEGQQIFGRILVVGGVPVMAVVADGLFRTPRAAAGPDRP